MALVALNRDPVVNLKDMEGNRDGVQVVGLRVLARYVLAECLQS